MKNIHLKFIYALLGAIGLIIVSCANYQNYWDNSHLSNRNLSFSDVYRYRNEIVDFRTDGFYYHLDSVQVYKMKIWNEVVLRYKEVIEMNSKRANQKRDIDIIKEYKAYYFDYFWITKDGCCLIGKHNNWLGELDASNYLISDSTYNLHEIEAIIQRQMDSTWQKEFGSSNHRRINKGVVEFYHGIYYVYYFLGSMELPDNLEQFIFTPINDSTLKVSLPIYQSGINPSDNSYFYYYTDTTFQYNFYQTKVIPADHYMNFR